MHARARQTQRPIGTFTSATKQVADQPTVSFFADRCDTTLRDEEPAARSRWTGDLGAELEELFSGLIVPDLFVATSYDARSQENGKALQGFLVRGEVVVRSRRVGRDPKKVEVYNQTRREKRRRERRRRHDFKRWAEHAAKRWAELRARPLEPVEIDGVIWMKPCAELEEHRRRARERARGKKAA